MKEEKKSVNVGQLLAEFVMELPYGQICRYQDIERITRFRRGEQRYYNAIAKAKKILVDSGRMMKPIGGGDYQVIYPGDYSDAYVREIKIARNHVKRGGKILKGAPVNDMTSDERQKFNNVQDFHSRLQAQIAGNYVEVKRLAGRKEHPLAQAKNTI